eukprot:2503876-Pyramimonas_sp.AAC.1
MTVRVSVTVVPCWRMNARINDTNVIVPRPQMNGAIQRGNLHQLLMTKDLQDYRKKAPRGGGGRGRVAERI